MSLLTLLSIIALSFSVISLTVSVVGVWVLRKPPPDYVEINSRVLALDQEVTDVNDRLGQWMRRESIRKMREGKEAAQAGQAAQATGTIAGSPADRKAELRRRWITRKAEA